MVKNAYFWDFEELQCLIKLKMHEYIWESRITYHDSVLIYFENLRYPKTGLCGPKMVKKGYFWDYEEWQYIIYVQN